MSAFTWHTNNSFDPFAQSFTVLAPDGITPVVVHLPFLTKLQTNAVVGGICEGSQVGAAAILLVCLFLVTKTDKRRSLVFMFNALALLLVFLRGIFSSLSFSGPFYDWYRWETYYYDDIGNAQAISCTAEIFNFLLVAVIEISLVLQVQIVCCTLDSHWRKLVNLFNGFVALMEIAARFALMVLNIEWNILGVANEQEWQFYRLGRLGFATNVLLVISIAISTIIFCAKLGLAIRARRSMGMKQFGPMQIIFVMGCQTMFTPLIFTVIAYFAYQNADMQSFIPTVVALSLPLSAMWAAANTTHHHIADPDPNHHRHAIPVGRSNLASAKAHGSTFVTNTTATHTSDTLIDDDITTLTNFMGSEGKSKSDLEMQAWGDGVHVDRTYSVRCD